MPGEETLAGAGVSYCATCDGAFFRNKTVAVVGGGDVALEDALYLAAGCEKVYLIHRRQELRGTKVLQEQVANEPKITFLPDTVVKEICGEQMVDHLVIANTGTGEEKRTAGQRYLYRSWYESADRCGGFCAGFEIMAMCVPEKTG